LIKRFLETLLEQKRGTKFRIVLDFEDADAIDSRVAEFLQQHACRLSPLVELVFAGARRGRSVEASLSRWADLKDDETRAFATTEEAVRACVSNDQLHLQAMSLIDSILAAHDNSKLLLFLLLLHSDAPCWINRAIISLSCACAAQFRTGSPRLFVVSASDWLRCWLAASTSLLSIESCKASL
jgi:hypothetical protein